MINYELNKKYEVSKQFGNEIFRLYSASYGESPWTENTIITDLTQDNRLFISAYSDKQLVGFLSAIVIFPEAEITNIAVLPNFRRQGIGKQLLQRLQKQVETIFLEVRMGNSKAKKLYLELGFYEMSCRKDYYQNPKEDALLMEWRKNVYSSN